MNTSSRRHLLQALAAPAARPAYNVLFLMSDEHSPHAAGFLGNRIVKTPPLDSLAGHGTVFTAAYTQNPLCVPSRASFVTGRMASNVGVIGNTPGCLDESVVTIADVFNRAGYAAGWLGKTHWGGNPRFDTPKPGKDELEATTRRGRQSPLPEGAQLAPWPVSAEVDTMTKNQALRFLEQNRSKRFFCGVSFRSRTSPSLSRSRITACTRRRPTCRA